MATAPPVPGFFVRSCASCGTAERDEKHKACARCKKNFYCGVPCQKAHWAAHKSVCSLPKACARVKLVCAPEAQIHLGCGHNGVTEHGVDPRNLAKWAHVAKPQRPKQAFRTDRLEAMLLGMSAEVQPMMRAQLALLVDKGAPTGTDYGAVFDAFDSAMPSALRAALIKNGTECTSGVSLPPEAQWLYSLLHTWSLCYKKGEGFKGGRIIYQDRDLKELLIVDVKSVLTCPEGGSVPHWSHPEHPEDFKCGAKVVVGGLASRPDLNGAHGTVKALNPVSMRYDVHIDAGNGADGISLSLKHANLRDRENTGSGPYSCDAPFVLVRFLHITCDSVSNVHDRVSPFDARSKSFNDGWIGGSEFHIVWSESLEDIRVGVSELHRHCELLSKAYHEDFRSLYSHHREGNACLGGSFFRPSFLVPPQHVPDWNRLKKQPYCCANPSCGVEDPDAKHFHKCSQCKSVLYCCKACQKAHWISHRIVCGKSAKELDASLAASDAHRDSFVLEIDCCPLYLRLYPPGWIRELEREKWRIKNAETGEMPCMFTTNINCGGENYQTMSFADEPMPKNIYGDDEFMVKIQVPVQEHKGLASDGSDGGMVPGLPSRCMIYDRRKTFGDQYFDCDTAAKRKAFQLVRNHGIGGGLKAYFSARRQGANIRVYVDRVLPVPTLPW